jgi:hypothetical protein
LPRIPREESPLLRTIIPCAEIHQSVRVSLLAGIGKGAFAAAGAVQVLSIGSIALCKSDLIACHQLAHRPQCISHEVVRRSVHLCNAAQAVEIGIFAIPLRGTFIEHLGQASVQVENIGSGRAINRLLIAVTKTIVSICSRAIEGRQSIGGIIGISVRAIIQQITVVIERVGDGVHAGEKVEKLKQSSAAIYRALLLSMM